MKTNVKVSASLIETLDFQVVCGIKQACEKLFTYPLSLLRGIIPLPWFIKHKWFIQLTTNVLGLFFHKLLIIINYPIVVICILLNLFIMRCETHEYIIQEHFGEEYKLYNFNYFFIIDMYFAVSNNADDEVLCFSNLNALMSL